MEEREFAGVGFENSVKMIVPSVLADKSPRSIPAGFP
jgi:hypothetical protein